MVAVASRMLDQEARALLSRLSRLKPFAVSETMVTAAAVSLAAQTAIEKHLAIGRRALVRRVRAYLRWIHGPEGQAATPDEAQRRFTLLRLLFNNGLSQFELFAHVLAQRSEGETGVWLSGLDVVAEDALKLPGFDYDTPPLMCYLDRGPGASIRRARTRLPGGDLNPVAIIQVPRERMIGSGVASSLVHEVGHQAAALLGLIESLRPAIRDAARGDGLELAAWKLWERWISEIVSDFWSVAKIGIAATLGLIAVVSLPSAFVFRLNANDPHPTPWIRVKLSCAMGRALFPHDQWDELASLWDSYYPTSQLARPASAMLEGIASTIPDFVETLIHHRPASLRGLSLAEAMEIEERSPARLAEIYQVLEKSEARLRAAPPTLVIAAIGQARADGRMSPEKEARALANLLTYWALRSTLDASEACAMLRRPIPVFAPSS
jgi:hypothetical protein